MNAKCRILIAVVIIVFLATSALPAFASHQWSGFTGLACNSATHTLSFTVTDSGGSQPGLWIDVRVNGVLTLDEFELWPDNDTTVAGTVDFEITDPSFVDGALIQAEINDVVLFATCTAPVEDCAVQRPDGFQIRSVPAGAYAYYQPNADTYAGFVLPAGTWYTKPTADYAYYQVWISCAGNMFFIPAGSVVG